MNAREILDALLAVATAAKNSNIGGSGGPANVQDWLNLVLSNQVTGPIKDILDKLTAEDFDAAIAELVAKRGELIADPDDMVAFGNLAPEVQGQVLALSNAIVVLAAKNEVVAAGQNAGQWLAGNVLPLLQHAIPIVLTLL